MQSLPDVPIGLPEERPAFSRALLIPGPMPPLSHLGVTLLRHATGTGLRYALYHLGLPLPEAPPVRTIRLRPYLHGKDLRPLLADVVGGQEVLGALLEPEGAAQYPATPQRLGAALAFHRVRLLSFRPPAQRPPVLRGDESPEELLQLFRSTLSRVLPRVGDALLADLIAAINRRAARGAGEEAPPVLSRAAWNLRAKGRANLFLFGPPDLLFPSWAGEPERAQAARKALEAAQIPGHDRFRGRFREAWRAALDLLSPVYAALARQAAGRGLLDRPEDAYFLPLDVAGDLTVEKKPSWIADAVRNNRAEYDSLRRAAEPLDRMTERQEMAPLGGERPEWDWTPLLPLP
ncbi:MAG TPA: hypothetical protein VN493_22055 [Thermoanaerobaculia bacterium]|nr:hypothetical protein [Thermoanaerobaculia bacterium]